MKFNALFNPFTDNLLCFFALKIIWMQKIRQIQSNSDIKVIMHGFLPRICSLFPPTYMHVSFYCNNVKSIKKIYDASYLFYFSPLCLKQGTSNDLITIMIIIIIMCDLIVAFITIRRIREGGRQRKQLNVQVEEENY